jgi:hypothetical protein
MLTAYRVMVTRTVQHLCAHFLASTLVRPEILIRDLFTGTMLEQSGSIGPAVQLSPSQISSFVFHPPIAA